MTPIERTRRPPNRRRSRTARKGLATLAAMTFALAGDDQGRARESRAETDEIVSLPRVTSGATSLDETLMRRRSVRAFTPGALSREQLAQLCWAAQGITEATLGLRTAPSAGALYPLELYVVLADGVFHYEPRGHRLRRVGDGDRRDRLAHGALGQDPVRHAAADLVITAVVSRTRTKYGDRAERYAHLEAGHAAQNVLLEATALGLGAVPVGAFDDDAVRRTVGASPDEVPLYVLAVGKAG